MIENYNFYTLTANFNYDLFITIIKILSKSKQKLFQGKKDNTLKNVCFRTFKVKLGFKEKKIMHIKT